MLHEGKVSVVFHYPMLSIRNSRGALTAADGKKEREESKEGRRGKRKKEERRRKWGEREKGGREGGWGSGRKEGKMNKFWYRASPVLADNPWTSGTSSDSFFAFSQDLPCATGGTHSGNGHPGSGSLNEQLPCSSGWGEQ